MNSSYLKTLRKPIVQQVKLKGKIVATVNFYNDHDFPKVNTKTGVDDWLDIADVFTAIMYKTGWTNLSKEKRANETVINFKKIFPDYPILLPKTDYSKPANQEVLLEIKRALELSTYYLRSVPITVNIFPRQAMEFYRVTGFIFSNVTGINMFIDGRKGWQQALISTLSHEYMHVVQIAPYVKNTLTKAMIREGVAQHFEQAMLKRYNKRAKLTGVSELSLKETKRWLKTYGYWLNRHMSYNAYNVMRKHDVSYHELGYALVQIFLQTLPSLSWNEISYLTDEEIFNVAVLTLNDRLANK